MGQDGCNVSNPTSVVNINSTCWVIFTFLTHIPDPTAATHQLGYKNNPTIFRVYDHAQGFFVSLFFFVFCGEFS